MARHYCYVEPGDELVERRVTTDVFFGNLRAELVDAAPDLLLAAESRYAAGLSELEATLAQAAASGRSVVLIVDGLDHISRVRADSRALRDDDTDIVERLATLDVPSGVSLVIGSQPGPHLAPIRERWGADLVEREVLPWTPADVVALARRHGVARALTAAGIARGEDIDLLLGTLATRAGGNPLYARYLARGLVAGLGNGSIANAEDWLNGATDIAGDVALYYAHLYRSASVQGQAIADLLGVVDFAVTEAELKEILPGLVAEWVPVALSVLAPLLASVAGQGGLRVFHESFRRYMVSELANQGRSVAAALEPVIAWLTHRGFFRDAKSYRFLLPAFRRAGRDVEVLAQVSPAFVSESVAHGHPPEAIQRNLALAADVAARKRDWPALVRCVELQRAAYTCFDGAQNSWGGFWATYLDLFGADALAERLLFEGRPTLGYAEGLLACSLVDDAGGNAPWGEYLKTSENDTGAESSDQFDPQGSLSSTERIRLLEVHGQLRLGERSDIVRRTLRYLRGCGDGFSPLFVRGLASRLARATDPMLVERVARRGDGSRRGGPRMSRRAAGVLRLGLADEYARRGNSVEAAAAAAAALGDVDTPELAIECVGRGASPAAAARVAADPSLIDIAVEANGHIHDARNVRTWVASIRLTAHDPGVAPAMFAAEHKRVAGDGWYRCWLQFVLELANVDAARRRGANSSASGAFTELTRELHPFRGTPRACDLYPIWKVIEQTISWGLSLLQSVDEWRRALEILSTVSHEISTSLDREEGGPLATSTLIALLTPYSSHAVAGPLVREVIEREVERRDSIGTYYSAHAEYAMQLARARQASGDAAGAARAWATSGVYLTAYGFHKDITLFDIIESAPALRALSRERALSGLADLQPLTAAVIAHTDGRSTNHAPNAWLRSLLEVDPSIGIALLARSASEEGGSGGWPLATGIRNACAEVVHAADPRLVDAVLRTGVIEIEDEHGADQATDERLAPIASLATKDRRAAVRALRLAAAELLNDGRRHTDRAAMRIASAAAELSLPVPKARTEPERNSGVGDGADRSSAGRPELPWLRIPAFPVDASLVDLLLGLRAAGRQLRWDVANTWDSVTLPLSYHLDSLIANGREDDACRILRFFARDVDVGASGRAHPLEAVARALDNAAHARAAAVAYTLAYTATRGGMGWLQLGGREHSALLLRGVTLDAPTSLQVLADEVAYALRGNWYSAGTSRHLVERLVDVGRPQDAEASWVAAFEVIRQRLPLSPDLGWFAQFDPGDRLAWNVDEALVALVLARVSEPLLSRKVAALGGFVTALQHRPEATIAPLQWWLTRDASTTSVLLGLQAIYRAEASPFPISRSLQEVLTGYAQSDLWGAQRYAGLLLERAGLPVPGRPRTHASGVGAAAGRPISATRRSALLDADVGDVLERLAPIWRGLTDFVTARLDNVLTEGREAHTDRARERFEAAFGRDGESFPPTPVLRWETELFQAALLQELNGLSPHLWATGQWAAGLEDSVLALVIPDSGVHLSLAASRTVRPPWEEPAASVDGTGALPVVADDDPMYFGWTRLAAVELQYLRSSGKSYARPTEKVMLYAGAMALPLGGSVATGTFPFGDGDVSSWWDPQPAPAHIPPRLPLGRLVQITRQTDWLGDALVLIPPEDLLAYLALQPPTYAEPLAWSDASGEPTLVMRTWRVRNPEALFAEPVEFEGADLLAHPDVVDHLEKLCRVPLREVRVVSRKPILNRRPAASG